MSQQIVAEQRQDPYGNSYWLAWLSTHPDNYSLGGTEEQAIAYLKSAIKTRTDIYGEVKL